MTSFHGSGASRCDIGYGCHDPLRPANAVLWAWQGMSAHHPQHTRPVWAEISAHHLRENYRRLQAAAGPGVDVLAVVKANAYGHGATGCAPVLAAAGASWLGVTGVEEGIAVRRALAILPQGMVPRILVMCGLWIGEAEACLQHALTPVVWEPYHFDLLQAEAKRLAFPPATIALHLEIDTGMSRQGIAPGEPLAHLLQHLQATPALHLEGVLTHFASAEVIDDPQNQRQRASFERALRQISSTGLHPPLIHVGNTSGVDSNAVAQWLPHLAREHSAQALTRAGLALYGYALPLFQGAQEPVSHLTGIVPILDWKTRIVSLRDIDRGETVGYNATYIAPRPMRLALLPVGYADGFRRALSSTSAAQGSAVLLHGRRAPIVGRVSMDLSIVDVTGIPEASIGDEAVLLGRDGTEVISAAEHARFAGTNIYEILCGISDRVPRIILP